MPSCGAQRGGVVRGERARAAGEAELCRERLLTMDVTLRSYTEAAPAVQLTCADTAVATRAAASSARAAIVATMCSFAPSAAS